MILSIVAFLEMAAAAWAIEGMVVTNTFDNLGLEPSDAITSSVMGEWWTMFKPTMFYTTNTFAKSKPGCIRFTGKPGLIHLLQAPAYRSLDFLEEGCSNGTLTVEAYLRVNGTNSYDEAGFSLASTEGRQNGSVLVYTGGMRKPGGATLLGFNGYHEGVAWVERVDCSRTGRWERVRLTINFEEHTAGAEFYDEGRKKWVPIGEEHDISKVLPCVEAIHIGGDDESEAGSFIDDLTIQSSVPVKLNKK